ncbi:MAG: hypothetical protein ABJA62_05505 [Luteimonas sp.]
MGGDDVVLHRSGQILSATHSLLRRVIRARLLVAATLLYYLVRVLRGRLQRRRRASMHAGLQDEFNHAGAGAIETFALSS